MFRLNVYTLARVCQQLSHLSLFLCIDKEFQEKHLGRTFKKSIISPEQYCHLESVLFQNFLDGNGIQISVFAKFTSNLKIVPKASLFVFSVQ